MAEHFDELLLDHIKNGRNDEAKAMLNEDLARAYIHSDTHGTLLHHAAEHNNAVIARRLIELGADVNRFEGVGITPLATALMNYTAAVVQVLLGAGARVDIVHDDGSSALEIGLSTIYVETEAFKLLVQKLRTEASTNDELAEMLIRSGCCMPHAATLRDVDLMECMLRRGVDVNSTYDKEITALHVAAELNDVALADWLMKKGIDVDALDEDGSSSLLKAVEKRYTAMVKYLLEHGAYPDVIEELHDYTPLSAAFMCLHEGPDELVECIELLLQHRASLRNSTNLPEMFQYALNCSCDKAAKLLIAHLAMLEMLGEPVDKSIIRSADDSHQTKMLELQKDYEPCQQVLKIKVFEKLSFLDLLNESDPNMRVLVGKESFLQEIEKASSENKLSELYPYYYNSMMRRIEKAKWVVE